MHLHYTGVAKNKIRHQTLSIKERTSAPVL
nr:MAG TPA: hypothetical protein [Caudoviricetes sp.]